MAFSPRRSRKCGSRITPAPRRRSAQCRFSANQGHSPLLFGKYLMESTAFAITLEDISDQLPSYEETVLSVDMGETLAKAYESI